MRIRITVIWLFLFVPMILFSGQEKQVTNKWINYTDQKNVISAATSNYQNSSIAYCATTGGLYVVDLTNGEILKTLTNLNGLISINLTSVYVDTLNRAWVGASDGSIVIYNYFENSFRYIYDIKNSNESNKSINGFIQVNQNMFVATSYGIQKISIGTLTFVDAPYYQLGTFTSKTKVNTVAFYTDKLYAGTDLGIAYVRLRNTNLNNPSSWINYSSAPMNSPVKTIEPFNGFVYSGSETGCAYFDQSSWNPYPNNTVATRQTKSIKKVGDSLYIISSSSIFSAHKNSLQNVTQYYDNGSYNTLANDRDIRPIIGATEKGILMRTNTGFQFIFPNCPYRNIFDYITIDENGVLWAAGGTPDAGIYKFDGTQWSYYTTDNYPQIGGNFFRKVYTNNGNIWAIGYGSGPTLISGNTIKNYNTTNSNLPGTSLYPNYCTSFGGAFDINGRFWCSFFESNTGTNLYAYKGDSIWIPFVNTSQILNVKFGQIAVDNYNTKWIVALSNPSGLYFINENGTINNPADDIYGFYTASDFTVQNISFVVVDKNNEVWVTTENGVYIIANPLAAIQNPNNKPVPQKLGIISGNLKVPFTENCRTISVDILNHKWIGTEDNGVFHLSQDGTTLIEQFNKTNSPLLSNQINTIAVNPFNGTAYFGTSNGLSSVKTDAVKPVEEFDKIICSPNPYIVPSGVNLKIDGLVENSSIKILSLTGEVIAEFESPGGRIASWNGIDKKGNYVSSGIYIVAAYNKDGSKAGKGKLAVIKK